MKQFTSNEWTRRGKKYKAQTMSALKQLYGNMNDDKDCQSETSDANGSPRTDSICGMDKETGILGERER